MISKKKPAPPANILTIQILSYEAEKIHQALLTAASAASMGRKVYLYFTKSAAKVLQTQNGWQDCPAAPYINTQAMDDKLGACGIADFDLLMTGLASMAVDFCISEEALKEFDLDPLTLRTNPPIQISALSSILAHGRGGDWITF